MKGRVNLEIKDIGSINNADINISKINVVGGVNSSGKSIASKLLYCYLKANDEKSLDCLMKSEGLNNFKGSDIAFKSDLNPSDIFYLESISILDLKDNHILSFDHIKHVKECLEVEKQDNSLNVLSQIQEIINGECSISSSAGIKQIGVIQILLENNSMAENAFLIIDEPESNLHPDWQIKFAQILVLLSKELNITLYLNSYSPIFIEAISLYSQYYDLIEETNFYLTKMQDNGKFDFVKITPRNMGAVYENLTKPYDELDNLKAKIIFKE